MKMKPNQYYDKNMKHLVIRRKCSNSPYKVVLNPSESLKSKYDFSLDFDVTGIKNYFEQHVSTQELDDKYQVTLKLIGIKANDIFLSVRDNTIAIKALVDDELYLKEILFKDKIDKESITATKIDNEFVITIQKGK